MQNDTLTDMTIALLTNTGITDRLYNTLYASTFKDSEKASYHFHKKVGPLSQKGRTNFIKRSYLFDTDFRPDTLSPIRLSVHMPEYHKYPTIGTMHDSIHTIVPDKRKHTYSGQNQAYIHLFKII